jgi:hypothetical protein
MMELPEHHVTSLTPFPVAILHNLSLSLLTKAALLNARGFGYTLLIKAYAYLYSRVSAIVDYSRRECLVAGVINGLSLNPEDRVLLL